EAFGFLVVEVDDGDLCFRHKVGEEAAQLVHALVVERDVVEDGDGRVVERDGAVALVDFGDKDVAFANDGGSERRVAGDQVLHRRAVHQGGVGGGGVEDPADHAGDGGLARRAADGDRDFGGVDQLGEELRAGELGAAETFCGHNIGHGVLDGGGGDEELARV